jgi:hypothetical protein
MALLDIAGWFSFLNANPLAHANTLAVDVKGIRKIFLWELADNLATGPPVVSIRH